MKMPKNKKLVVDLKTGKWRLEPHEYGKTINQRYAAKKKRRYRPVLQK